LKRIFIGSFLQSSIFKKNYIRIKKEFGGIITGRWIPEKNLHLTYRFLGNVSDTQLISIRESLAKLLNKDIEINLELKGLGVFPSLERPRVFFVKISHQEKLHDLYAEISSRLKDVGFKDDTKTFIPHITLKRIKQANNHLLQKNIKRYEDEVLGVQKKMKIYIIESVLTPQGAVYKILK